MAADAPKDKFRAVWLAFFVLGLGTLLPWNFFMTATVYFTGRLKESSNATAAAAGGREPERSVLEAKFNNVMTLCAMTPLLVFTCLNSFLYARVPEGVRVAGSLALILAVFLLTAVLVKVQLAPAAFFAVTMLSVVVINSFGAVLQGSLFGMAGALPAAYTAPIMSGQGLAGTFAALAMICAIASMIGRRLPSLLLRVPPRHPALRSLEGSSHFWIGLDWIGYNFIAKCARKCSSLST